MMTSSSTSSSGSLVVPEKEGLGQIVADHYNKLEEKGQAARLQSRIYHMRAFNNWIKSMLISDIVGNLRDNDRRDLNVLDMCCGKGGDILKWNKSNSVRHVVFADIAKVSVEQCEDRYTQFRGGRKFSAEFIVADCTKEPLQPKYKDQSIQFDITSIQFSFHYSFESLEQAKIMIKNAADNLRPGGYFIGTIPNANRIVRKLRESDSNSFGNEVYKIQFENPEGPFPLFGTKYYFQLEGVVDCPEFLVHFPCFEKLAKDVGLKLLYKYPFDEYFKRKKQDGYFLLERMAALECYPPQVGDPLVSQIKSEYEHADEFLKENPLLDRIGTLTKSEWEAISLYTVFAFEKI